MKGLFLALVLGCVFAAAAAKAQDRPNEDSMFGSSPSTAAAQAPAPAEAPAPAPAPQPAKSRDESGLEPGNGRDAFATGEVPDNPLQIGGIYYQRWTASFERGQSLGASPVSMPLQFDAFMDDRPNDHVRGYIQERILYDPTRDEYGNSTSGSGQGSQQYSSTSGAPQSFSNATSTTVPTNPTTALDQAWLKFDLNDTVFATVGKQHVRWGTARFWNPTDFLNTQRRDPLLPYDLRLGNTMAKFEMPLDSKGSNLYAIALIDNPQPGSTLGQTGGAFRYETLLGNAEVGVEALSRGNVNPTYGADFSAPIGPFDVYSEAALYSESPVQRYALTALPTPGADVSSLYTSGASRSPFVQVAAGAKYDFAWEENRQATVGVEYFYNQLGYSSAKIYPVLIFLGTYEPFYTGKNYAAVYVTAEGPDEFKHTSYTFSTLGNLSDGSFLSRLDFSWRFLTYMTFEAYVDNHYGTAGGEFNFEAHTPPLTYQGNAVQPINIPETAYDIGMGLRVSF